ncbi:MAG TPA: hypothetical protein EYH41_00745 [Novosphingobium capsulatum]|nr:hypothetical protein [Novosphingobium capsulatum]
MGDDFLSLIETSGISGIKAPTPWGLLETESPLEGIIVAVGISVGICAMAYSFFKSEQKKTEQK